MKKIIDSPFLQPGTRVVVRSWGDEPVDMFLYSIENNGFTGIVGRSLGVHTIGVPIRDVYPWDAHMREMARRAHESRSISELHSIYESWRNKSLELVEPVEIDSKHDQEHVAHPERSSAGSEQ